MLHPVLNHSKFPGELLGAALEVAFEGRLVLHSMLQPVPNHKKFAGEPLGAALKVAFEGLLVCQLVLTEGPIEPEHFATVRDLAFQGLLHSMLCPVLNHIIFPGELLGAALEVASEGRLVLHSMLQPVLNHITVAGELLGAALEVAFEGLLVCQLVLTERLIEPEHFATVQDLTFQGLLHSMIFPGELLCTLIITFSFPRFLPSRHLAFVPIRQFPAAVFQLRSFRWTGECRLLKPYPFQCAIQSRDCFIVF